MSARAVVGAIAAVFFVAVLALDLTGYVAVLIVGLVLLGVFVGVDGWQARRDQRQADRQQVARMIERTRR